MNSKKILIFSILIMLFSLISCWFGDYLLDKSIIISVIAIIIFIISYLTCLLLNNKSFKLNRSNTNKITEAILILNFLLLVFFPFRYVRTKVEFELYNKERNQIIEMIKNNEIKPNEYGNCILPKKFKKTSISSEVVVYKNLHNEVSIGFWIFRGLLSNSTLLIYSSEEKEEIGEYVDVLSIDNIKSNTSNWYYVVTD